MNNKLFKRVLADSHQVVVKSAKEGRVIQYGMAAKANQTTMEELKKNGM